MLIIYMVGCYKAFDRMFYCLTFHWLLKIILHYKQGETIQEGLDQNLKEIVENDEEMANAIIDTENDVEEEDPKKKKEKEQEAKNDSWKGNKIKERRK